VQQATGGNYKSTAPTRSVATAAIQTVQNNFGVHINYVWIGLLGLIRVIVPLAASSSPQPGARLTTRSTSTTTALTAGASR
jgi:hypothetical protein